jgi:cytochrome c-type biogenesis protein CcmH/NrfF
MRLLWFLPVTVLIIGGLIARARRRGDNSRPLKTEPVSGQWLAEARSREEHPW